LNSGFALTDAETLEASGAALQLPPEIKTVFKESFVIKSALFALTIVSFIVISGCQKKEIPPKIQPKAEPQKTAFIPPSDSSITIDRMKKWVQCNPYLDSLSILYKDSFAINDISKQPAYQENFLKAQDKICVRVGITGGYAEYLWILKNIGNPKNKPIVDSLKLTTYQ
jgi:hypothetical protein